MKITHITGSTPFSVPTSVMLYLQHGSHLTKWTSPLHSHVGEKRNNVNFSQFCAFNQCLLFFNIINSVEEVNTSCLHILLSDELPVLWRYIISSLVLMSQFICFAALGIFLNSIPWQLKHNIYLMWTKTSIYACAVVFCDIINQHMSVKAQRKGDLCDKERKLLHGASKNYRI